MRMTTATRTHGTFRFGGGGSAARADRSSSTRGTPRTKISWSATTEHAQPVQDSRRSLSRSTRVTRARRANQGRGLHLPVARRSRRQPAVIVQPDALRYRCPMLDHVTIAALSFGDIWRAIPGKLDFQGGARFDEPNVRVHAPAYNAAVDSLFAVRTDRVPSDQGISPRFGFSWRPGARRSNVGCPMAYLIDHWAWRRDASRGWVTHAAGRRGTRARGGQASDVADYHRWCGGVSRCDLVEPRGCADRRERVAVDDAVPLVRRSGATPVPDWSPLASVAPSAVRRRERGVDAVRGDATGTSTSSIPAFRAPVSWRGNARGQVAVRTSTAGRNCTTACHTPWARTARAGRQPPRTCRRTAAFTLAGEANRPVFAPASATSWPGNRDSSRRARRRSCRSRMAG